MDLLTQLCAKLGVEQRYPAVVLLPKSESARALVLARLIATPEDTNPEVWSYGHLAVGPNEYLELGWNWEEERWEDMLTARLLTPEGTLGSLKEFDTWAYDFKVSSIPWKLPHMAPLVDSDEDDNESFVPAVDDDDWYDDEGEAF